MFVGFNPTCSHAATVKEMNDKPSKPNPKRRAILQGSLAAPVVLTVSSPSAASVTSLGKCLTKHGTESPEPFINNSADTWLRKPVDVFKLEKGNGGQATDWVYFDEGLQDFVTVARPNMRMNIGPMMEGWKKGASDKRWGLVWVEEKSGIQYSKLQIQRPSGYTATTNSCYATYGTKAQG